MLQLWFLHARQCTASSLNLKNKVRASSWCPAINHAQIHPPSHTEARAGGEVQSMRGSGETFGERPSLRSSGSGSCLCVEVATASPDFVSVVCSKILSGAGTTTPLVRVGSPVGSHAQQPPEVPTCEVDLVQHYDGALNDISDSWAPAPSFCRCSVCDKQQI